MSYSTSAMIMLAAGIGVPVLAALNAYLGKFLGSPLLAVTTLLFCRLLYKLGSPLEQLRVGHRFDSNRAKVSFSGRFVDGLLYSFYHHNRTQFWNWKRGIFCFDRAVGKRSCD